MSEASLPASNVRRAREERLKNAGPVTKVLIAWNRVAPFFVSAALFLSGFFALFSPLPLLMLGMMAKPWWVVLAVLTNSAVVYWVSGATVFQFYLLAICSIGLVMPLFIKRRFRPEQIIARTWILQWALVGLLICTYALIHGITPIEELSRIFASFFDQLFASISPESRAQLVANFGDGETAVAEWRKRTLTELPGALGVLCLLISWFNFRILINLNPGRFLHRVGLDRRVLNRWKNPEWLVWPTIAAWGIVLFTDGMASDIALNVFKILMASYGLQGIAVLGSLFESWKIRGLFRMLLYALVILVMLPLLLSIGFFDQWFDFRAKFRQS